MKKNNWQGPRARAVIVSDDGRFWYVSRDGVDEEVGAERKNSYSQVERLTLRLGVARTATTRGSPTFPHRNGGTTRRSM